MGEAGDADTADVVVIGGGVIGCAVALELARRRVRVRLLERAGVGAGASSAAAGMLGAQAEADGPGPLVDLALASRALYPELLDTLRQATGIDCQLVADGVFYCAMTDEDEILLERRARWQIAAGLPVIRLTAEEARQRDPTLGPRVRWALHFPAEHGLNARRLVAALGAAATCAGVSVVTTRAIVRILADAHGVAGVAWDGGTCASRVVVNAAGAWGALLALPDGVVPPPVFPLRGQIIALAAGRPAGFHALYSTAGYVVRRGDGRLLAGSTFEEAGYSAVVTVHGAREILAAAVALVPELAAATVVESWAGLRPVTPDGAPILGAADQLSGLFYATGHGRQGIVLAPITARILADLITESAPPAVVAAFRPGRFSAADHRRAAAARAIGSGREA
jgi:glycine oxidase